MRSRPLVVALAWLPVGAYTGLIWYLSSQALTVEILSDVPMQDKGVHFLEYGGMGLFMAHALHVSWPDRPLRYVAAVWLSLGLGLIDELHQFYVPGRSGDALDLLADALGIVTAVLGYALLRHLLTRRSAQPAGLSPP